MTKSHNRVNLILWLQRTFVFSLLWLFSISAYGQGNAKTAKWTDRSNNKSATFYDVQKDFNQYWEGRKREKGKGYKPFKRWEAFMAPRVYPTGNMALPSTTYDNFIAWQQSNANRVGGGSTTLTTGNWTELGPVGSPSGPSPYTRTGAGRLSFVRFDPTNTNTMYVGAPDGGLWKSTNGGTSWTTNTDFLTIIGCSDLCIDPTNTQIMYLATGDLEGNRSSRGVLKSTDGGATWNTTGANWIPADYWLISKMLMNPSDPLNMIVSTNVGIFRTTDGWATSNFQQAGDFKDMEFKPGDANTVYAAGKEFWKSTDNGVTWAQVTTGLPSPSSVSRIALGVTAGNAAYVYALIGNSSDNGYLGMYRSTNSGTSFSLRSSTPNLLGYEIDGSDNAGQAFYDLAVTVSPTNAEIVTTGGINHWQSTDGGTTWNNLSVWDSGEIHADIHEINYLPGSSTTMFSCNDGGIFKSTDNGNNFVDISNNLAITQVVGMGNSATVATTMVEGSQDNGTCLKTGSSWANIYGGDGGECFIDPTNNNTIYIQYVQGAFSRSDDGGASNNAITTGLPTPLNLNFDFYSQWFMDPVNPNRLYVGGIPTLYTSANKGDLWTTLGTPVGTGSIKSIAVAPSNTTIIYAIKNDAVSKSTNSGASFSDITGTLPVANAALSSVTVSNTDPNKVWVTFSGYSAGEKVFKSVNGGTSWTNVSTGLPNLPMNEVVYTNGSATDAIYIAGDIGVYYLDNSLASFAPFMTDLPNVAVRDLEIYYPTGKLRAGTYGRGVWESDLYAAAVNYTITASAGANGTISPIGAVSVASGANQTFTITANSCYTIADVLVDGVSQGAIGTYTFTNVTAAHTISATFSQLTYNITASAGANGSISPSGVTSVNCGANQTYTITANSCYTIADVLVDGVSQGAIGTYTFTNVTAAHTISATFTQLTYNITASAGANGTVSPNGVTSVNCGANQTYTITANSCYTIADVLVDGVSQGAIGTYTFTNITAAHTISATFSQLTYNITASAGANGTVSPNGVTSVNCGANQTYTITANSCYVIADVLVDGISQGAIGTYTFTNVTATHTISATFTQLTYNITASAGANGTISPNGVTSVNCGDNQTYTITPNGGFSVLDVLVDGVSQGAITTYTFTNVTATHTISATFVSGAFTITASAGPNGSISPSGAVSVTSGANQTFNITANSCYAISDVLVDGVSQGAIATYTFTNVTATHTISATFTQLTYNITASAGPNGSISPNGVTSVNCGTNQTYNITANSCYAISDVLVDGVSQGAIGTYTFTNVTATHTISATFTQLTYNINASAGANGTISPNGVTSVNCGDNQTYTITPNGGFNVQDVLVDGVSQGAITTYTFTNVTATHTISATFVSGVTNYTITATTGANGTVSPNGITTVSSGNNQSYTITANSCYQISDVLVDGVSQGAIATYTFTNVTANHTISASFSIDPSGQSTAATSATTDAANNNICNGNTVNLTANGGTLGTGAVWTWYSGSCGGTLVGTGASITVNPNSTRTYFVRAEGACGNTSCVSVTVTVSTAPVTSLAILPFIGMPANVCNGITATLSIPAVTRATYYTWDAPAGSYFNGVVSNVSPFVTTTPSVTITYGNPSGSLYSTGVQAGNACGNSIRQAQKTRGTTSVPASISGTLVACANTIGTYSTAAVDGASSYLWTITGNATVTGTGTSVTVNFGAAWNGGTLCVASRTSCYTSTSKCIAISKSAAALGVISGTFTACPNSTLNYSVPASAGAASYNWTLPAGATGSSTSNSISVAYGPGYNSVGSICVSVTSVCGVTSAPKCKTVAPGLPLRPASINGPSNGLCGQTVVYSCPTQGVGTTYNWTAPAGATISGNGNNSVSISYGTFTTGSVCVTATNGCGTSPSRCVSVKGAPNTPAAITASPSTWCANATGILFTANTSNITGSYILSWLYPSPPVATYVMGGGNSSSLTLNWGTGNGNVVVIASNACGSGSKSYTATITCRQSNDLNTTQPLQVYPNPVSGLLNVNYLSNKGNTQINLLDVAGRLVLSENKTSVEGINHSLIDLSYMAKGNLYYCCKKSFNHISRKSNGEISS